MFRRIRKAIDRLFDRSGKGVFAPRRRLGNAALGRRFLDLTEGTADRLSGGAAQMGEVSILNLAAVQERIGDKWPLVARHVHLLMENVLSRHVGNGGFFFQCDEGVYGIAFAAQEQEHADRHCAEIQKEIMHHLFGDVEPDEDNGSSGEDQSARAQIAVRATSFQVDTHELRKARSPGHALREITKQRARELNEASARLAEMDGMIAHAERRFSFLADRAQASGSPAMIRKLDTLLEQLRSLERSLTAAGIPKAAAKGGSVLDGMTPVSPDFVAARPEDGPTWQRMVPDAGPMQRLARMIQHAEVQIAGIKREANGGGGSLSPEGVSSPAPDRTEAPQKLEWQALPGERIDFSIDFVPVIGLRSSVKGIYMPRPRFRWGGTVYEPRELFKLEGEPEILTIADRLCLRRIAQTVLPDDRPPAVQIATVHQTTLELLSSRRSYMELASQVSKDIQRTLLLRIVFDTTWRHQDVSGWISLLQPYFGGFVLEFPIDDLPVSADLSAMLKPTPRQAKLRSIGFSAIAGARGRRVVPQAAEKLVAVARETGVRSIVFGVEDARMIERCRSIGVRKVSSLRHFPPEITLGQVEKIDMAVHLLTTAPVNAASHR